MDEKQKRLVNAWIQYGTAADRDYYGRFISIWVAFNAICYARYGLAANRYRADLRNDMGLESITCERQEVACTVIAENDRVKLQIERPWKVVITIAHRYTEDIIYTLFAKEFQSQYESWLEDAAFRTAVLDFRQALEKRGRYYVVNMARASDYNEQRDYRYMKNRNIVVAFEDVGNLKQLKDVLYQVRCNVFHGEKVPGDVNDDRIVKHAYPVLLKVLNQLNMP